MGIAIQHADALLDIASEYADSGKTPSTDLREGVRTLPMLYALGDTDSDPDSVRLRELLGCDLTDDTLHAECLGLLRAHPSMERARTTMLEWADQSRAAIATLPDVAARKALDVFIDLVVSRSG